MSSNPHATEYAELKWLLAQQGLFNRRPLYYTGKVLQHLIGMVIHVGLYLGGVFSCLGVWTGMAFILVHQMLFGLYMAFLEQRRNFGR